MANKLFAEVVIAGSYKNLAKSTRGATKELKGFEASTKKMANAVKGALAGVALGGFALVTDALIDMTKAASDDAKSMALLNKQMENSFKSTTAENEAMDAYLQTLSNMTGVLDDDLRPAMAKIVRATKNSGQAMKAFDMVMDISAGTGKDVNVVAQAYSRYLAGNKTALERMIPGLKDAANQTQFLQDKMAGMAKVSGANSPFARLTVIAENFKEQIGEAFLPLATDVADFLASPEAQKAISDFAQQVKDGFAYLTSPQGKKDMKEFIDRFMKLIENLAITTENVANLLGGGNVFDKKTVNPVTGEVQKKGQTGLDKIIAFFSGNKTPSSTSSGGGNVTLQVNVDPITGNQITKLLKNTAGSRGIPLAQLLR
jgi:hypothetical protein